MKAETILCEDALKAIQKILEKNHRSTKELEWIIIEKQLEAEALELLVPKPGKQDKKQKKAIASLEKALKKFTPKLPKTSVLNNIKVRKLKCSFEDYKDIYIEYKMKNLGRMSKKAGKQGGDKKLSNVWYHDQNYSLQCNEIKYLRETKDSNRIAVLCDDATSLNIIEEIIDSNKDKNILVIDMDIWNISSIWKRFDGRKHSKKAQYGYLDWLREFNYNPIDSIFEKPYFEKMVNTSQTNNGTPYQLILSQSPDKGIESILNNRALLERLRKYKKEEYDKSNFLHFVEDLLKPDLLIIKGNNRLDEAIIFTSWLRAKTVILDQVTHQFITKTWKELGVLKENEEKINLMVASDHTKDQRIEKMVNALTEDLLNL